MMQKPLTKIKLEITHQQALQLFGLLDSADERAYTTSLEEIYNQLQRIATNHFLSQQ
jgi:hypothetical protein